MYLDVLVNCYCCCPLNVPYRVFATHDLLLHNVTGGVQEMQCACTLYIEMNELLAPKNGFNDTAFATDERTCYKSINVTDYFCLYKVNSSGRSKHLLFVNFLCWIQVQVFRFGL